MSDLNIMVKAISEYRIPLFDIDWTLIEGDNKAAYDSYDYTFKQIYGVNASIRDIVPHRMIDSQIMIEILKLHGIREEIAKEKLNDAFNLSREYFDVHESHGRSAPMPGA